MYVVSGKIPSLLWNGRRNRDEKNLEHNSKFQQMIRKLLVLLLCLTAATATAKKPKSSASKKAESSAEKPKESDYDKLFKEKHTVADGMFRLHDVKGKLYFEIPDSLFGREMLLGSTISEVSDNAAATTGSKSDYPLHVVFTRNDRSVQLRTVNCENITDETGASRALAEAVKRNTADPILRNYKIEAWNRDSTAVVVNVTDLFVADVEEMSPFSKYGLYTAFELKKTFQKERSMLGEIKAFSDNVVVRSTLSYIFTLTRGRTTLVKDQPLTAVMTRSLVLLPREPYRPRITDSRMSVFPTGKVLFSEREQRAKVIYYAHRWRLEPSDMDAWKRGERVAPKKQIVFYVDDGFPEMWKKHIFEAVDQWNEPFGRIGFKNAIAAKPYPKDDPEFDPDNIKYSCIRYAPIAIANAMGPSWVDPRSGEILNASVYVYHDVMKLLNNWLFVQTAQADERVRAVTIPEEVIGDGLRYVVAHEVGHCLGYMHNMSASAVIPVDSLLGRGLMITTTIEWTGDPGDGLAHQQPVPPYMVEFGRGKSDTLLCMREFAPVVIVDGSPAMREAVGRSNIGPIVASYAVKARTPDGKSSVVDVTALFVGDVKRLRPIDPEGGNTYGGWMTAKADYKKDRSMLTGVTGGKGCVSVVGELSYGTTVSFLGLLDLWKDKPQSIVARRTLRVLGDPERRMRLCDQRLGLAAKAFKRFSDREQEAKTDYYACRRSILDSAGKVRPVVFYVDTAFDASAYAAVERGLLLWNDAFAKIGCKDVVRVEPFPADPAFNDNSLYNNCVRRTGTSNSELYTASWVDPRSGEILGTDIFVPFNFTAAIQKKLLLTLSAADPEARTTQPSARQIADALTAMVARRAASAFGVMPNYAASSAYPTDSLRSPSFTRENGLAASITDDVFYNIVAQPGDRERGVKLVADALGPYDYLAVEWLYKPVPGAVTPHDEVPELRRLLASKEGDPRCFFAQYASGTYDPRVGAGDLGDDLFRSVALQSANLKYVAEHGDGWLSGRDGDYKFREELLTEMVLRVNSLALQLMRYIGGVYMNPVYEGTARPACTAVPREVQRRALREALALTADLGWIDRQGVSKNVYNRVQACEYLQRRIARTLLEKLGTLGLAASKADDPYTADLMAKDLVAWFEERLRSREPLTDHVRNLQQSLLKSTVAAANVKDKPSSGSGSAFALFDGSGSLSDGGDLFPATDAGALPDMPAERRADDFTPLGAGEVQGAAYGYRTPRVIPAFREHLFYGLLLDMKAMYRRGAASAPLADTRSFCRYMADRIDRELAVE